MMGKHRTARRARDAVTSSIGPVENITWVFQQQGYLIKPSSEAKKKKLSL